MKYKLSEAFRAAARRAAQKAHDDSLARTHCSKGHALTGDNLIVEDHGKRVRRFCRICRRKHWAKQRQRLPTQQKVQAVFEALAHGATLGEIMGDARGPQRKRHKIIHRGQLQLLRKTYPKLDRRIIKLAAANVEKRRLERPRVLHVVRSDPHDVLNRLHDAVPAWHPARDDIVSAAALAIYEGRLTLEAACAGWQQFTPKYTRLTNPIGVLSLDITVPGTDNLRLLDTVTRGFWD